MSRPIAEDNKRNGHELLPNSTRIPIAPWTRLRSDLAPYLSERSAPGTAVLHFYHRNLFKAVRERYLPAEEQRRLAHRRLADYFHAQDYWLESPDEQKRRAKTLPPTPRPANVRKVDELPWQLLQAADWQNSEQLLTDLAFLEGKVEAGMVFDLAADFSAAIGAMPADRPLLRILRLLEEALRRDIHFIARHPTTVFQCMWNTGWWHDCSEAAKHYHENNGPWMQTGAKLFQLIETWRIAKEQATIGFFWLRSMRPPPDRIGTSLRSLLSGHTADVTDIAISVGGDTLISSSVDSTVRIWELKTGGVRRYMQCDGPVSCIALAPDGACVGTGGRDRSNHRFIRLWDVLSGTERKPLNHSGGDLRSLAFSPDGRRLASGAEDNLATIWDIGTGRELMRLSHPSFVASVAFSPDGHVLATGATDSALRLWDATAGTLLTTITGHTECISSVSFSPDGTRIVTASGRGFRNEHFDPIIRVWDARTGQLVSLLEGHRGPINKVLFSPDGCQVASAGGSTLWNTDNIVRVWDWKSGKLVYAFEGHQGSVNSLAFLPAGKRLASCSDDGTIRIWQLGIEVTPYSQANHEDDVRCVSLSDDGTRIATVSWDETVRIWNSESGLLIACLSRPLVQERKVGRPFMCVTFSKDGRNVAAGGFDRMVRIWEISSNEELACLAGHKDIVNCVAFSHDGKRIASGSGTSAGHPSDDISVRVWDLETRSELFTFRVPTPEGYARYACVNSVAFSPDDRNITVGVGDEIVTWDLSTHAVVWKMESA